MAAALALAALAVIGDTLYRMAADRACRLRETWDLGAFDGILDELDALDATPAPPEGGSMASPRARGVQAGTGQLAA